MDEISDLNEKLIISERQYRQLERNWKKRLNNW